MFLCPSTPIAECAGLGSSAGSTRNPTGTASAAIPLSQKSAGLSGGHRGSPHQGSFAALVKFRVLLSQLQNDGIDCLFKRILFLFAQVQFSFLTCVLYPII